MESANDTVIKTTQNVWAKQCNQTKSIPASDAGAVIKNLTKMVSLFVSSHLYLSRLYLHKLTSTRIRTLCVNPRTLRPQKTDARQPVCSADTIYRVNNLSICLSVYLSISLHLSISLSIFLSLSLLLSLSLSLFLSLSFSLFLSPSLSPSPSPSLFLSINLIKYTLIILVHHHHHHHHYHHEYL